MNVLLAYLFVALFLGLRASGRSSARRQPNPAWWPLLVGSLRRGHGLPQQSVHLMVGSRPPAAVVDVRTQLRLERNRWRALMVASLMLTGFIAALAYLTAPQPFSLAFTALLLTCCATFIRPAVGVYAIVLFGLIGDTQTASWWPFTMNLSMRQSTFFVQDSLAITPMEIVMGAAFVTYFLRSIVDTQWRFHRGRAFGPVAVFGAFVVIGFFFGVLRGGVRNIALIEARALIDMVLLYLLIPNVLRHRRQYRIAFGLALVGVTIQSVTALSHYRSLTAVQKEVLDSLGEHAGSLTMNVLFIFLLCLLAFRGKRWIRWTVAVMLIPVTYAYLLAERRAAMVGLFAGMVVFSAVLFQRERRVFWRFVPALAALGALFVAATWNAQGALSLPASAVKTVFFPGQLPETESGSDAYRVTENYNLWYTIRNSPLTGLGFGHKFHVVWPMPNISFFELWQYLSHNSVLWVWIKMGFFGFVAMLVLFGRVIQLGAMSVGRLRDGTDLAMVVTALSFVPMFLVFAYVDIAWSVRPAIVLGLAFALCADFAYTPDAPPDQPRTSAHPAANQVHRVAA